MSIGMKRGTVYLEEHRVRWEGEAAETVSVIKGVLQCTHGLRSDTSLKTNI